MMYFCYERSSVDGHWQPAVYYDDNPSLLKSSNGKESNRQLSKVWEVPGDCCDPASKGVKHNGQNPEPNFGKLQARFPKP